MKIMKIKKYIEYIYIKIIQKFKEKKYKYNNMEIKYIFEKNRTSKDLIIIFSACTRKGIKARYNYIRTIKKMDINKLFILDDFAEDKRGEYYIGEYPEFLLEKNVKTLIDTYIKKINVNNIFFVGSSKGGYAALNFGVMYDNSKMIVGAPQFWLGKFLLAPDNKTTLNSMVKDNESNAIEELNEHLKRNLLNNIFYHSQKIYIHYSDKEHTYMDHIIDLLKILNDKRYNVTSDIGHYKTHDDVSMYYPQFLLESLIKEGVKTKKK